MKRLKTEREKLKKKKKKKKKIIFEKNSYKNLYDIVVSHFVNDQIEYHSSRRVERSHFKDLFDVCETYVVMKTSETR